MAEEDPDFPLKDMGESVIAKGRLNDSILEVREDEVDD